MPNKKDRQKPVHNNRAEKWGELLAELTQAYQLYQDKKTERVLVQQDRLRLCYQRLETKASKFQPRKLKKFLTTALYRQENSQTIISHSFKMANNDSFKNFILQGFKTNYFLSRRIVLNMTLLWRFVTSPFISIFAVILIILSLILLLVSPVAFWQWLLAWLGSSLFFFGLTFLLGIMFQLLSEEGFENFLLGLRNNVGIRLQENILITDRRQIKLSELRLLFLELEKFELQPILHINRKTTSLVEFKLQIKVNSDFIQLLK